MLSLSQYWSVVEHYFLLDFKLHIFALNNLSKFLSRANQFYYTFAGHCRHLMEDYSCLCLLFCFFPTVALPAFGMLPASNSTKRIVPLLFGLHTRWNSWLDIRKRPSHQIFIAVIWQYCCCKINFFKWPSDTKFCVTWLPGTWRQSLTCHVF